MENYVLVTGTSRGIGRATALRLARSGWRVFGAVRSADDASSLEAESRGSVRPVVLDITSDDAIESAVDELGQTHHVRALKGLVNVAAAQGRAIPMEAITRADLIHHFQVAVAGTAVLTASLVPLLEAGRGRIVNVGAGPLPLPLLGAGLAAKHGLEAISDVTRVELAGAGVGVSVVEPGMTRWADAPAQLKAYNRSLDEGVAAIRGPGRDRYERAAHAFQKLNERMIERGASADSVAIKVEHALSARRPRRRYYCGTEQRLAAIIHRVAPTAVQDRMLRRMLRI